MLTAITRAVSPGMVHCELTFVKRQPMDLAKASAQHHDYELLLAGLGARVISLAAEPALPDSMFVEDPAIVLDELAVIFPLGMESRRAEAVTLARAVSPFRPLKYIVLPGTMEGGDVLRVGRKLFVGLSSRTNAEGLRQLTAILEPHSYQIAAVPVTKCLHLKSAVTYIGQGTLLANPAWVDRRLFPRFEWIAVAPEEPHAANALAFGGTVILPASCSATRAQLKTAGFHVTALDISELQKAESGLTCSSLIFEASIPAPQPR